MSALLGALLLGLSGCSSRGRPELPPRPRPDPDLVQRGAMLFRDPSVAASGDLACETCHPGGGSDGNVYDGTVAVSPGSANGRRTTSLRGAWQTPPYFWDGSAPTLRDAVDQMLQVQMGGPSLPEHDVLALEAYVQSLPPFDRGRVLPNGEPREPVTYTARRGGELFEEVGCDDCHPPPSFAAAGPFDVGTGGAFDAPTLRGASELERFGHDGRWTSLEEAIRAMLETQQLELSFDERLRLLEYVKLL